MPDLSQCLSAQDMGFIRIVADLWGIELQAPGIDQGAATLEAYILDAEQVTEMMSSLPGEARTAVHDLQSNAGRKPWAQFVRRYGQLREMGPGRRDRERPYLDPVSTTEVLWYRSLIARDFFETPVGLEEFAYIPDDILQLLSSQGRYKKEGLGRPARRAEYAKIFLSSDRILDFACTLLAGLRSGLSNEHLLMHWRGVIPRIDPPSPEILGVLLRSAGLLDEHDDPITEPVRVFLEMNRREALSLLMNNWMKSPDFNDLRLMPGLTAEGEWVNDPLPTRMSILEMISAVPGNTWWSLPAFLDSVREEHPDFQRPSGDYDSWFLRDSLSGEYLRGFKHWDAIDGALIHFVITGMLHWLGITDLAAPEFKEDQTTTRVIAFRLSKWSIRLLNGQTPEEESNEKSPLKVRSDGRIYAPRLTPRSVRYQVARFTDWEPQKDDGYLYKITSASLERARQQGLKVSHILALLNRHSPAVPPSLERALNRWQERGVEAKFESVTVLRVTHPEILKSLKRSKAARFLGDPLGTTSVIIKPGGAEKIRFALVEMGFLGEIAID
jgi:hypothetical protein